MSNQKYKSLTVQKWTHLATENLVAWQSNNPNVYIDGNGWMFAPTDKLRPYGLATIKNSDGDEYSVTIVPWETNRLELQIEKEYPSTSLQGLIVSRLSDRLLASDGSSLYETTDDFTTLNYLSELPESFSNTPILETPHGYFARTSQNIYRSTDLLAWTHEKSMDMSTLYHTWDYYFDGTNVYIYAGEYGTDRDHRFKVFRGVYSADGQGTWDAILEFFSQNEYAADNSNVPKIRHVHLATVDQRTGDLYIGTGDNNNESYLMLSQDNGSTFRVLGRDSQVYRILSVWFTDEYIYWNMDTSANQSVYRISRADLANQSPENDLREEVALLNCGSHWYHCWGKTPNGDDIVLMGVAPEGQPRDWLSRVFSFNELSDGSVEVDEVISLPSSTPDVYDNGITIYSQLEPKFHHDGFVYLRGRYTDPPAGGENSVWLSGLLKTKLVNRTQPSKPKNWKQAFHFSKVSFG